MSPNNRRVRRRLTLLAACFAFLAAAPTATAQVVPPGPSDEDAAAWQYRETFPAAGGPVASGGGRGGPPVRLSPNVAARIRRGGGADAELLTRIATSPQFGAPRRGGGSQPARGAQSPLDTAIGERDRGRPGEESVGRSIGAAFSATAGALDESDGSLLPFFAAVILVTAAAFGAAAYRRRPSPLG